MEICGKQILYTKDCQNLFFLNAYARVVVDADGVFVGRTDKDTGLLLKLKEKDKFLNIVLKLRNGVTQEKLIKELKNVMPKEEIEDFINRLIQEGVID